MRVVFRADASIDIGTGHVMRCLTLAEKISNEGGSCYFICREHYGNLISQIKERGFSVKVLPLLHSPHAIEITSTAHAHWLGASWQQDANISLDYVSKISPDWLVVDHYALDYRWEERLRNASAKIMVIDDLADRRHNCDLLLDQTYGLTKDTYKLLVPSSCRLLVGAEFVLLRPEFSSLRGYSLRRRISTKLNSILITMGGVDKDNVTGEVLDALSRCILPADCKVTVIMGATAPWLRDVIEKAAGLTCDVSVLVNISHMAQLMADSDLAIGAAGSTSWERCCLGVPSILIALAENQKVALANLESSGAVLKLNLEDLNDGLCRFFLSNDYLDIMNKLTCVSSSLVNGLGSTKTFNNMRCVS